MDSRLADFGSIMEALQAEANLEIKIPNKPKEKVNVPELNFNSYAEDWLQRNIECRDQYRNNSGKIQLPESVRDLPDSQIYFYNGHGGNVCKLGIPIVKTVPDNCIYITQTVCGIVNTLDPEVMRAFIDPKNNAIWKDPIAHLEEIKELFDGIPSLHIHLPGCTYLETSFYPFSMPNLKKLPENPPEPKDRKTKSHYLQYSGLWSLESVKSIPLGKDERPWMLGEYVEMPLEYLDGAIFQELFQHSIYPPVKLRDPAPFRAYVPESAKLDGYYLNQNEERRVDLYDIVYQSHQISGTKYVSDLMEQFPGIHYNFLCRSMDKRCKEEGKRLVTLRRRHSAVLQNSVYNNIRKLIKTPAKLARQNESPLALDALSNDNSVLDFIKIVEPILRKNQNFDKLFEIYTDLRFEEYTQSKEEIQRIIEELYLNEFINLLDELGEKELAGNHNEEKRVGNKIFKLIDLLEMDINTTFQEKFYAFELSLLAKMGYAALLLDKSEVVTHICETGIDVSHIEKEFEDAIKNKQMTQEVMDSYKDRIGKCKKISNEAQMKPHYQGNSNTSSNNNTNKKSQSGNGYKKTRKLRKRKSSAA